MTTDFPTPVKDQIHQLLLDHLEAKHVEIRDMTEQHANHVGAKESGGGHYIVTVVSEKFNELALVKRHRLVYGTVERIRDQIHALGISAYTPSEWSELRA